MHHEVFEVLEPGLGATLQDRGRVGWRRFGVPPGGVMDDHAAGWANRLLDNPADAPVVEFLLQGAKLKGLSDTWIAITGSATTVNVPAWRAVQMHAGDLLEFSPGHSGVWIYLAVEGGFEGPRRLGSASVYARGQLGRPFVRGDILYRAGAQFVLPGGVAGRIVDWQEQRNYHSPPRLRVWPGPQRDFFSEADCELFFAQDWTVSSQSDRVGYRLDGTSLRPSEAQILSEPVVVGSIQVATNGQPIVTMRDGPTVGGYPKLGLVEAADLSWLAQCRPGVKVRFQLAS